MKSIIFIHGFLSSSLSMKYLAKYFDKNYNVYFFDYNSREYDDNTLKNLHLLISSITNNEIFIVAHSMGGLVIKNYLNTSYFDKRAVKVITIATPHNTSLCAQFIYSKFPKFFGNAKNSGLLTFLNSWNTSISLGCIAGLDKWRINANFFLIYLMLFKNKKQPNDGTIFIDEAFDKNSSDNIILPASHTGLLFNKKTAIQIENFLINNAFNFEEKTL